jgi:hypothetical protein
MALQRNRRRRLRRRGLNAPVHAHLRTLTPCARRIDGAALLSALRAISREPSPEFQCELDSRGKVAYSLSQLKADKIDSKLLNGASGNICASEKERGVDLTELKTARGSLIKDPRR